MQVLYSKCQHAGFIKDIDGKAQKPEIISWLSDKYSLTSVHTVKQVHGTDILLDSSGDGDGIIITRKGTGAVINTADCFPVVIIDDATGIAAIIHSGWKGTVAHIVLKGAQKMIELGAKNPRAVIFPGIGACCFEIGPELLDTFASSGIPVSERNSRYYGDLFSAIVFQLWEADIKKIDDLSECTFCKKGYYSYRRDKGEKRHLSFVALF